MKLRKHHKISCFSVVNTILLLLIAFIMLYHFWYVLMGSSQTSMSVASETAGYAATVITMIPILCVYPFLQKHFVHELMVSSVKE